MRAFPAAPQATAPQWEDSVAGERIYELRTYESHNEERARAKIDMFCSGEMPIFDKCGFQSVFYGECLVGSGLPCLKYMLAAPDLATNEAGWKKFVEHPDWLAMRDLPQYKDTVSNIQKLYLAPTEFSQLLVCDKGKEPRTNADSLDVRESDDEVVGLRQSSDGLKVTTQQEVTTMLNWNLPSTLRALAAGAVLACLIASTAPPTRAADPPGYKLVWSDEFDSLDESKWLRESTTRPTNNSLHAYLPEQATVADGNLVMTSENKPYENLAYRSASVKSKYAQRFGRWEVRAQLPTGAGLWPAIWLLPDAPWPSQGEIDVMEFRGDKPALVTSAFHWGSSEPYAHDYHVVNHQAARFGKLVRYDDAMHDYAVEWEADQIRFYVDDVYHAVFYSDECGDVFPKLDTPMKLILNTAVGGDYASPPDDSTRWPQKFLVDSVKIYQATGEPTLAPRLFNGGFEEQGGSLAAWHVFGNALKENPNVQIHDEAVRTGKAALKIFGPFADGESYSGVSQGIAVVEGQSVRARLQVRLRASDALAGTKNQAFAKIEFYKRRGSWFGGPDMLGVQEQLIADGATLADQWHEHELTATVPAGAVEARLSIVFRQVDQGRGAIHVDDVEFAAIDMP